MENFEELIEKYDENIKLLVKLTRTFLINSLPGIIESVDLLANMLAYAYGPKYKESICTLILSKKGLKIGFYGGASFTDNQGLLKGAGKVHKHYVISKKEDLQNDNLKSFIEQALLAYKERN